MPVIRVPCLVATRATSFRTQGARVGGKTFNSSDPTLGCFANTVVTTSHRQNRNACKTVPKSTSSTSSSAVKSLEGFLPPTTSRNAGLNTFPSPSPPPPHSRWPGGRTFSKRRSFPKLSQGKLFDERPHRVKRHSRICRHPDERHHLTRRRVGTAIRREPTMRKAVRFPLPASHPYP